MKKTVCNFGNKRFGKTAFNNYFTIRVPGGWVKEHILLIENRIKRFLYEDEVVHHVDFNKDNNNINNLIVLTKSQHQSLHNKNIKLKKISDIMSKNSCKKYNDKELIHPTGYRYTRVFGGHVLEHKYVIEKRLKRTLKFNEVVHHKDGNKLDNNLDNLIIMNYKEHRKLHWLKQHKDTPTKHWKEHYNKTLKQWKETHEHPNLGKKYSEESRQKMSKARKKYFESLSDEKYEKYCKMREEQWTDEMKEAASFRAKKQYSKLRKNKEEYKKHCEALSKIQKVIQGNLEIKKVKSEKTKLSWQDPKVRKLRIERLKEVCNTPRVRALHSKAAQIRWGKE